MKRMLFFVAGTKGGVGKSFFCTMFAGAAMDLNLSVRLYDTDEENQTLTTLMRKDCIFLNGQDETYPLDTVINHLLAQPPVNVTIVDMKAGTSRSTQDWFSSIPWDELKQIDLEVYLVGCVTADFDSVKTIAPWLDYFRKIDFPVKFLLIKNEKDGKDFFACNSALLYVLQREKMEHTVFTIPPLEQTYMTDLNSEATTVRDYLNGNGPEDLLPSIMQRSRLRKHYLTITDPMILFMTDRIPADELTEQQQQKKAESEKRLKQRCGASNKNAEEKQKTPTKK